MNQSMIPTFRSYALAGVLVADCRAKLAAFNLGVQTIPKEDGYRLFRLPLM
jgi:hypothetical protein